MGIIVNFKMKDIEDKLKKEFLANVERKTVRAFSKSCLEAVNYAKSNHAGRYKDQTGALNSSTGFQLYKNGELVESFFEGSVLGDKTGNTIGVEKGNLIASKVSKTNIPIVAVIVAGMNYALEVESKGYDVITGAEHRFTDILKKNLQIEFSEKSGVEFSIQTIE